MAAATEKPKALVFAVMRNGHEVLRSSMKDMTAALELNDEKKAVQEFTKEYRSFKRWQDIHGSMEEGKAGVCRGFFKVLDEKCDNVAKNASLYEAHVEIHSFEQELHKAIESGEFRRMKEAYSTFARENEGHLKQEEEVMMPMVMKMKKSGVPLKKVMMTEILPAAVTADMKFFLVFAMQKLEKVSQEMPRARVFAHAIQANATEDQWVEWKEHIKEGLSAEGYEKIRALLDW